MANKIIPLHTKQKTLSDHYLRALVRLVDAMQTRGDIRHLQQSGLMDELRAHVGLAPAVAGPLEIEE